jgi:hypothetical protein
MPLMNFVKCWRGRSDCESFTAIEGLPPDLTEEQFDTMEFEPVSFVCAGCIKPEARRLPQDAYRFCFKNSATDEMSDNDEQDLSHMVAVASHALAIISTRRVNGGMVEVPAMQGAPAPSSTG